MTIRTLLAVLLVAAPLSALAEPPGQYWAVTVSDAVVTDDDGNDGGATNVGFHLGYHLFDFLGVELQGGGAGNGEVNDDRNARDTRYVGAFVRVDLPLENVNVYALGGAATVQYDEGAPENIEENSDVAAGFGIELYGTERTALRFEYMNYADGTYETLGLGIKHHFDWPKLR